MSNPDNTLFRWVREGQGRVVNFETLSDGGQDKTDGIIKQSNVFLVGTTGLRTCVGLYVKISDTRCLLLHINAMVTAQKKELGFRNRRVTLDQGREIFNQVRKRLEDTAAALNWTVSGQEIAIMCCPHAGGRDLTYCVELYTGYFVVKAIRTFLRKSDDKLVLQHWGAFIVDQKTGVVRESAPYGATIPGYTEVTMPLDGHSDWVFRI